jgi:hypothetical protein
MKEKKLKTNEIPQCNTPEILKKVVIAVSQGVTDKEEIERQAGLNSIGQRQADYYLGLAELLGLINKAPFPELTQTGRQFAALRSDKEHNIYLKKCVLNVEIYTRSLNYITNNNPNKSELYNWFSKQSSLKFSTAKRRCQGMTSFLTQTGWIRINQDHFETIDFTSPIATRQDTSENKEWRIILNGSELNQKEIEDSEDSSKKTLTEYPEEKMKWARETHSKLVDAKSRFLEQRNLVPKENYQIYLWTEVNGTIVLYEMKPLVINGDEKNLKSQIRKAIAQLYEYRYRIEQPTAQLCIITNSILPNWLGKYLVNDRKIAYQWTTDFESFTAFDGTDRLLTGELLP